MPAPVTLRNATLDDCGTICEIYNHYVLNDTCTYTEEAETLQERQAWFKAHGAAHPVIVAESEGRIIGWGSLSKFRERSAYRFTVEDSLYLRHEARGRGVGSMMLEHLLSRARTLGHRAIIAGISAEQSASIALHTKFGFTTVAHLRQVGFKFDRWLDVVYMELLLPSSS
jgi:L-amino acid N-acyltransferase YncA